MEVDLVEQSGGENGVENGEDTKTESEVEAEPPKRLRFVNFPPFSGDYEAELENPVGGSYEGDGDSYEGDGGSYEGDVRKLEYLRSLISVLLRPLISPNLKK